MPDVDTLNAVLNAATAAAVAYTGRQLRNILTTLETARVKLLIDREEDKEAAER